MKKRSVGCDDKEQVILMLTMALKNTCKIMNTEKALEIVGE